MSGADEASFNPAHPSREVGRYPAPSPGEVDRAVDAARSASREWRRVNPIERGRVVRGAAILLEQRAEEVARLITLEEGKTLPEARSEVFRTVETLHYHAGRAWAPTGKTYASSMPDEDVRTVRVPVGVVGVISPWNFPVLTPAWKIAPALVHGNTVVWKPASLTSIVAAEFVRVLEDAGVPAGVVNLVLGPGRVGQQIVDHPEVDALTFTGSTQVGQSIWNSATPRGVKVQLELGGHNAAIVFPDADLDLAAKTIVAGAMLSAGQKCTATRRVIALSEVHDELVERIRAETERLVVGDGLVEGVDVSPLVSRSALDEVKDEVDRARREGAELLAGGEVLEGTEYDGGHYLAPTVFAVKDPSIRLCKEEVFGPVTAVMEAADDDEAFELANATRFGLCAAVFTVSERRARLAMEEIEAGMININTSTTGSELHAPFGGVKASSSQAPREQGETAEDFFTESKTVYLVPGD
jgi:aldehyde dehydrogenase (NAD+)